MKGTTVLKGLLILLSAVFVIHQCVSTFYRPVKTENTVYYTAVDGFKITGLIIRDETLVKSNGGKVLHFIIGDGGRVAKNGVIANIYDNENASITLSHIDTVKKKITDLKELLSYNDLQAADLDLINSRVEKSLDSLVVSGATGNYEDYPACADALLSAMNRRQVALGETADFSSQLTELNSQLSSLSASLPSAKGTITAEQSGYFISKADGYENVLTCDKPENITPEFLKNIKPDAMPDNVVGKIVSDYEWYIAAEVPINESLNYKEGDAVTLYTAIKSYPKLQATVKKINKSPNTSKAVVIFSCTEMNSELAAMRSGPMTVVRAEYSGLKVSKQALRVVDSKRGVYVLTGMQVKFVAVNIIYSNDAFMICEKQTSDSKVLRIYDEVIVKGKKLYDGKIIS